MTRIDLWRLAARLRNSAKKRATTRGERFELTVNNLVEMLRPGVCSATGIPWSCDSAGLGTSNPWAPSLDRKDSSRGYVYGNVQVVVWAFNRAKGEWPMEVFARVSRAYAKQRRT